MKNIFGNKNGEVIKKSEESTSIRVQSSNVIYNGSTGVVSSSHTKNNIRQAGEVVIQKISKAPNDFRGMASNNITSINDIRFAGNHVIHNESSGKDSYKFRASGSRVIKPLSKNDFIEDFHPKHDPINIGQFNPSISSMSSNVGHNKENVIRNKVNVCKIRSTIRNLMLTTDNIYNYLKHTFTGSNEKFTVGETDFHYYFEMHNDIITLPTTEIRPNVVQGQALTGALQLTDVLQKIKDQQNKKILIPLLQNRRYFFGLIQREHWTYLEIINNDNDVRVNHIDSKGFFSRLFYSLRSIEATIRDVFQKNVQFTATYSGEQGLFDNTNCGRFVLNRMLNKNDVDFKNLNNNIQAADEKAIQSLSKEMPLRQNEQQEEKYVDYIESRGKTQAQNNKEI